MINFDFVENQEHPLEDEILKYSREIFAIGKTIKKELGLRVNPFSITEESFRIDSIAGSISFENIHINIWPKNFGVNGVDRKNNSDLKRLYRRVLETSERNRNKTLYISKYKSSNDMDSEFIHAIAEQYIEELNKALKHVKITTYETVVEKRRNIRGQILVQKELQNPILEPNIWCKYKKLKEDNDSNRLLLWGCNYLLTHVNDGKIKSDLRKLMQQFHDVNVDLLDANFVQRLTVPRQFRVYTNCLKIARRLFLNNYNRSEIHSNGGKILGFIINMEKAFENIVCYYVEAAARSLGIHHRAQSEHQLATSSTGGSYFVRPDDFVSTDKGTVIIDAKYKLQLESNYFKSKPTREDFYQVLATCIAYKTHEAILIYPEIVQANRSEHSWQVENPINGVKVKISSRQIDILARKEILEKRLIEILQETSCV
ncbi:5-methylcytosine-specific restriction endonuclease McrBC regulatory subunit McrC [Ureibacillus xyleni]|uniref:5-methylcytosine-specific restriction endonuclease McrBC regulatory subunit McrC n=1 Tax=Ureibacillus xyleni TaxID=614648 RepID=A0A285SSH5_9BACL|nr:hypothetical protein [Ureibacillus xyleni]SOC11350.1 5-methylcytosine-specific restriction endonuclease McrBC regulatory subunit McrC [Ureibacillus xyleni]